MIICFLAQFPPPIHGLSKAVDTLYHSCLKEKYFFDKIDITNNRRILQTLFAIATRDADVFYFTISQTKGGNMRDLAFLALIGLRRKKCIIHLHGGYYRMLMQQDCSAWQRWLNRRLLSKVERAIVLGDSLRNQFEGYVSPDRIRVVPNCIDDEFMPDDMKEKTTQIQQASAINVVYLSNFIKEKGYREVMEVARIMKERGKEELFAFHFAGKFFNKTEQAYFNEYVKEYDLRNVVLHGVVMSKEKKDLLENGHVMMLLTRYPNEGQPITLLEAMGNGMAVVTTNHSGIPDISTSDNGYVCDKRHIDVGEIVDFLNKCRDDKEYLLDVCEKNYRWVRDHFTERQYIQNMDKVFEEVGHERKN